VASGAAFRDPPERPPALSSARRQVALADLLAPGLWWLHGTRGSNVYLVEADDGQLALVDTGFASSAKAILEEVRAHSGQLAAILLTHRHTDHSGAAAAVREATGARIVAGRADCVEQEGQLFLRSAVGRSHVGRSLVSKLRRRRTRPPVKVDLASESAGEVLPGIRMVPAPGHTPGSVCFVVNRLGAAFVGDLVISHEGALTRSMRIANHNDEQYLETLRQFGSLAPGMGLPGHGQPILEGFGEALRELAALPRRPFAAGGMRERVVRLFRFGRQMSRARRPRS
jgi:glyoxylase-like metal-dependent hydrolase (beta-lactamase superfamily II)